MRFWPRYEAFEAVACLMVAGDSDVKKNDDRSSWQKPSVTDLVGAEKQSNGIGLITS